MITKEFLEKLLKKCGKTHTWLLTFLINRLCVDCHVLNILDNEQLFNKFPALFTLLIIELAPELWKSKCHTCDNEDNCINYKEDIEKCNKIHSNIKLHKFIKLKNDFSKQVEMINKCLEGN